MPIRGHSGVQGGAEVGCVPNVDPATRANWTSAWGFEPPAHQRLDRRRNGGCLGARRRRRLVAGRRQLPRDAGRRIAQPRGARAALAPHPSGHRAVLGHAGRSRGHGDRPAGRDALRIAGRRHRDVDRAADHLFTRDSRPPHRLRARRVGSVSRRRDARLSRPRAIRGVSRRGVDSRGHRARGAALCRDRAVVGERRSGPVGRTLAVRRWTVRDSRRLRAFHGGEAARPRAVVAIASSSRRAAASSSTRWSSATSIRSPAPRATPC